MIKRNSEKNDKVKLTFVLPYDEGQPAVAVVGDFNNWNPSSMKLVKRANGTCSGSVVVDAGQRYQFRYYSEDGRWFNDVEADAFEPSEYGSENGVVVVA